MKVIRLGMFETNSSSTHTFTVDNQGYEYERGVEIEPDWEGEFGWNWEAWYTTEEKLAYICRCILDYNWDRKDTDEGIYETLRPLQERLDNLGVHFEIPTAQYLENHWGYVDHGDEYYVSDIQDILATDDGLLSFLFNPKNGIDGGNDNG